MKKSNKLFCLLLCLALVFSQMGFAFADTELQPAEKVDTGETQPAQEMIQDDESQEPAKENAEKSAEELLETAKNLADSSLPQILPHAGMRMIYEGQQAVKMADAFDAGTGTWKTGIVTGEGEEAAAASGDSFSYYAIEDAADWEAFAASVNAGNTLAGKTVVLTQNVDLSSLELQPVGLMNTKAGVMDSKFSGIFDGQGNTVTIAVNDSEKAYESHSVALFGCIENAVIKNLTVEGTMNITQFAGAVSTGGGISPVVGHLAGSSELSYVINKCDVTVTSTLNSNNSAGGIVATVGSSGIATLRNCANYGNISVVGSSSYAAGMIAYVGNYAKEAQTMINCFNEGKITAASATYVRQLSRTQLKYFKEVHGCYGADETCDLLFSYTGVTYDKRSFVSAFRNAVNATTYVPKEEIHSWKTAWTLNQADETPAYTLKDGKLQWAEAGSEAFYKVELLPYEYKADENPVTAAAETENPLGKVSAQEYYVTDGSEIKVTVQGTDENYPVCTITQIGNGEPGFGQGRFESNEEKKDILEFTLKVNGKNITLQYGDMEAYEQEPNILWYSKQESAFTLRTPGELWGFAQLVNAGNDFSGQTVKLGQDVDVSAETWEPIGAAKTTPFKGSFDGAGHQVTYKIDKATDSTQYQAFFSYVEDAQIRNLTVSGEVKTKGQYGAGLAASITKSTITDCVNRVNITSTAQIAAGISAVTAGDCRIEGCKNYGQVSASTKAAGILANVPSSSVGVITDCHNYGNITATATGDNAAGIAATYSVKSNLKAPSISGCTNEGSITSKGNVAGGIAGTFTGWMSDCLNNGTVNATGKNYVGGLVGQFNGLANTYVNKVEKSINKGKITGNASGGLVGYLFVNTGNNLAEVLNCYSTGTVTGTTNVGTLVGWQKTGTQATAEASIKGCFAYGDSTASSIGKQDGKGKNTVQAVYNLDESKGAEVLPADTDTAQNIKASVFKTPKLVKNLNKAGGEDFWGYNPEADYPVFNGFEDYPLIELRFIPFSTEDAQKYEITVKQGQEGMTLTQESGSKFCDIPVGFTGKISIKDASGDNSAKAIVAIAGELSELQDADNLKVKTEKRSITVYYGDEANYENFVFDGWYDKNASEVIIHTAGQMKSFEEMVNAGNNFEGQTVKLGKDIELSGICSKNGDSWNSIGISTAFSGTFDGQGHSISGMYMDLNTLGSSANAGLFGMTANAEIRNLTMRNSIICDTGETSNEKEYVGMLIGRSTKNLTISNVSVAEDCSVQAAAIAVGGMVGRAQTDCSNYTTATKEDIIITNAENHADVTLLDGKRKSDTSITYSGVKVSLTGAGGIIGNADGGSDSLFGRDGEMRFVFNTGTITNGSSAGTFNCAGGLIGMHFSRAGNVGPGKWSDRALPIQYSYNVGNVTAPQTNGRAAGISGVRLGISSTDLISGTYSNALQIGNCFSTGNINGETIGAISTFTKAGADSNQNYYVNDFAEDSSVQDAKLAEAVEKETLTNGKLAYLLDKGNSASHRTNYFKQGTLHPEFSRTDSVYKMSIHATGLDEVEGIQDERILTFAKALPQQMEISGEAKVTTEYFAKNAEEEKEITFKVNTPEGYVLRSASGSGIKEDSLKIKDKEIKDKETGEITLTSTVTVTIDAGADLNLYLNFIKMPNDYGNEMKVVLSSNAGDEKLWTLLPLITPPKKAAEISFDYQNGDRLSKEVLDKEIAKKVINDKISRKGYRFTGWYTDSQCLQPFDYGEILSGYDAEEHPLMLYAGWEKIDVVTITLNANGDETDPAFFDEKLFAGEVVEDQSVYAFDAETGSAAQIPAGAEPTRDGYTFNGWYVDAGTHIKFKDDTFTNNLTLYAGWLAEDECILTFDADSGYFTVDGHQSTEYCVKVKNNTENLAIADLEIPEAKHDMVQGRGYQFIGWSPEGSEEVIDVIAAISGNMKLVAKWKASGSDSDDPVKNFEDYIKNQRPNENGEFDTITISDYETLKALAAYVNAGNSCSRRTFQLGNDITLAEDWEAIGARIDFAGTFVGNGHTLTYKDAKQPLFGNVSGRVSDVAVTGTGKVDGGIASILNGGTIEDCRVKSGSSFEGGDFAGGIVGRVTQPNGTISGCRIEDGVSISGGSYVGGIAGGVTGQGGTAVIENCEVGAATIKGAGCSDNPADNKGAGGLGGILGYGAGTIRGCMANASVEAGREGAYGIGGIVGVKGTTQGKMQIERCGFTGTITAKNADSVGGILGSNMDYQTEGAVLKDVYASGTLDLGESCGDNVGGIMGSVPNIFSPGNTSRIENAYWNGKVTNPSPTFDPIAGNTHTTVSNTYYAESDGYESSREGAKGMPDSAFVSGELAYELDKNHEPRGTWTQGENGPVFNQDGENGIIYKVEVDKEQDITWSDGTTATITTTVSSSLSEKAGLTDCDKVFVKKGEKVTTTVTGIPAPKVVQNSDGSTTTTSYDVRIKDKNGDQILFDSANPTADVTIIRDLSAGGSGGSSTTTTGAGSGSGGSTGSGDGTVEQPGSGDGTGTGDGQGDGTQGGDGTGGQQGDGTGTGGNAGTGTGQTGSKGDKPHGGNGTGTDFAPGVAPKPSITPSVEPVNAQDIAADPEPSQASNASDEENSQQLDQTNSGGQSQGGGEQGEIKPESKIYKLIKSVTDTVRDNPVASAAILLAVIAIIIFGAWSRKKKEDHSAKK